MYNVSHNCQNQALPVWLEKKPIVFLLVWDLLEVWMVIALYISEDFRRIQDKQKVILSYMYFSSSKVEYLLKLHEL